MMSLLWGCADPESASETSRPFSTSPTSTTLTQPSEDWQDAITATTEQAIDAKVSESDVPHDHIKAETLVGRWEPQSYLPSQGDPVDLTALPPAQQADLVWVLTEAGQIHIGELEGTYTVEGETIYARNPDSGDVTEFQFQLSGNYLTVERKGEIEKGVLLLVRHP
ncbi:hypothetical protein NEA10_16140 [Phormidium yuhuli AB48]|uniref:Lipocalin-like domain-containing protein n=1 Tax=Phormidium yuhuli AB48 TaxID=2940671 RepID=A0ABY5AQ33_9CYAN|nr:hypothetical protein [Phormidium yuhuli]USR90354.1 hypothetical protein NEA10_16140 [Phormidium yuhuli AB48]